MQDKGLDFKHKEVVNISNGKRLGYVQDVCADLETGTITSIMVARKRIDINLVNPLQKADILHSKENVRKKIILQKRIKKGQAMLLKKNIFMMLFVKQSYR